MKETKIMLIEMGKDELQALIIDCVQACLKFYKPEISTPDSFPQYPELLKRHEVAKILGVSIATIDNYTKKGKLKKHYIGGGSELPRFKKSEVLSGALENNKNKLRYSRD